MSGHFPFCGKGERMGMAAFFSSRRYDLVLQERYYRWWYEWAKAFVAGDEDLRLAYGTRFAHFPYGQHARHSFHLNDKMWAAAMADLGAVICRVMLPKLDEAAVQALQTQYGALLAELDRLAQESPHAVPEVGYFRHT
jgi:hypothetical protein